MIGKLTRWVDEKGFGFIKTGPDERDVFVHVSTFPPNEQPRIQRGIEVEFRTQQQPDGRTKAVQVRILDGDEDDDE
jgi:cold shock CspA family protein